MRQLAENEFAAISRVSGRTPLSKLGALQFPARAIVVSRANVASEMLCAPDTFRVACTGSVADAGCSVHPSGAPRTRNVRFG